MRAKLQRCRTIWGRTEQRDTLPGLRTVTNAVYQPATPDGSWALCDADGTIIEFGANPMLTDVVDEADDRPTLFIGPLITHYGHFLLGTFARLWPLLAWTGPKPRLLCYAEGPLDALHAKWATLPFLADILARFGLTVEDLVTFQNVTRVPTLLVPEPSVKEQDLTHAIFGTLTHHTGEAFYDLATVDREARPVYLSKSRLDSGISRLRNEDVLCEALARQGVDIVFPEMLRFPELVRLLSERRMVMGTAGSAFHTAVFAAPNRRILALNWTPPVHANFPLLDALNGTQARYYYVPGSTIGDEPGFHFGWSIPDPHAVANEMIERANAFDSLDARDAAEDAARWRAKWIPGWKPVQRWLERRL